MLKIHIDLPSHATYGNVYLGEDFSRPIAVVQRKRVYTDGPALTVTAINGPEIGRCNSVVIAKCMVRYYLRTGRVSTTSGTVAS